MPPHQGFDRSHCEECELLDYLGIVALGESVVTGVSGKVYIYIHTYIVYIVPVEGNVSARCFPKELCVQDQDHGRRSKGSGMAFSGLFKAFTTKSLYIIGNRQNISKT